MAKQNSNTTTERMVITQRTMIRATPLEFQLPSDIVLWAMKLFSLLNRP
jgi:hypothetical protein